MFSVQYTHNARLLRTYVFDLLYCRTKSQHLDRVWFAKLNKARDQLFETILCASRELFRLCNVKTLFSLILHRYEKRALQLNSMRSLLQCMQCELHA